MDELLRIFLTWQFLIFCLGIAGITFIIRRLIEFFILDNPKMPGNSSSRVWKGVLLPIFPLLFGGCAGVFAKTYPYPEGLSVSDYGRLSFGLVAGLFSGLVFRVITELLKMKTTSQIEYLNNNSNFEVAKNTINNLAEQQDPSNFGDTSSVDDAETAKLEKDKEIIQ